MADDAELLGLLAVTKDGVGAEQGRAATSAGDGLGERQRAADRRTHR